MGPGPSRDAATSQLNEIYEHVILCVIKGNLRHRIAKLGCEKDDAELNPQQIKLKRIAEKQTQPWWVVGKDWARPQWANGAFVYLSESHAPVIEYAIAVSGKTLQSKHMLFSPQFSDLVKELLEAKTEGAGREAFQLRKAGEMVDEEKVDLSYWIGYKCPQIAENTAPDGTAGTAHVVASGWQHQANSTAEAQQLGQDIASSVQQFLNGEEDLCE